MLEKELSIYDIRAIGQGRWSRKFWKSPVPWLLLVTAVVFLVVGFFSAAITYPDPQYTLPTGEVVETQAGGPLIINGSVIVERDNPASVWSIGLVLMLIALGIILSFLLHLVVQSGKAEDKAMEEWLAAGYQPKATDV